jgi:hypothetical protein
MSISSYDGRCPMCYDQHEPHCTKYKTLQEAIAERLANPQPYVIKPRYYSRGNFITYFFKDKLSSDTAVGITKPFDKYLSYVHDSETDEVIGIELWLEDKPS